MKKLLALLLCLAMLLSYVPAMLTSVSADNVTPEDSDINIPITPDDEVEETTGATEPAPETSEEPEAPAHTAYCAACGQEVAWTAVVNGGSIGGNGHYYLTEDYTYTDLLPVIFVAASETACVDLNGFKLDTTAEISVKGTLNIQGEGNVGGAIGFVGNKEDVDFGDLTDAGQGNTATFDAALFNIAADAVVNIYGGTYAVTNDKPIAVANGALNVLGGEIKGTVNAGDLTLGGAAKIDLIETANLTVKADWTGAAVIAEAVLENGVAEGDFTGNLTTVDGDKVINVGGKLAIYVPVVMTGITVTAPTKVEYELGDELALDGMTVTGVYSDETTALITEGFTVTGFESETAGVKTVTVTYGEFTATFEVTVNAAPVVITGIEVTTLPTKVEYQLGEELALGGMVVTGTYSNETTAPITEGYTISGFDSNTAGVKTITVTYGEFTATFEVTVKEPVNVEMTVATANADAGIVITWTATGADKFQVYMSSLTADVWSEWTSLSAGTTSKTYTYKAATNGTQYKFKVVALASDVVVGEIVSDPIARVTTPTPAVSNIMNGVQLTWSATEGAEIYYIYRNERIDAATNTYSEFVKIGETTDTTYIDETAVNGGRYSYAVRTLANGNLSAEVAPASGKRILRLVTSEVTTENTVSGVRIVWTKNEFAPKYYLLRSAATINDGKITWGSYTRIATLENTYTYADLTAKNGVLYRYAIQSINNTQMSCNSEPSQIMRLSVGTATAVNVSNGIQVEWPANSGATAYNLYRSVDVNGEWSAWGKPILVTTETSYLDTDVVNGTRYRYMARPVNDAYGVEYISGAKTGAIRYRLEQAVINLANTTSGIRVKWENNPQASKYFVYRSTYENGAWTGWSKVATKNPGELYFDDTTTQNTEGVQYRYMVRIYKGTDQSLGKSSDPILRIKFTNLTATAATGGVNLSWKANNMAESYLIYRRTVTDGVNGEWELITWTDGTTLNYKDTTAVSGVSYQYSASAVNGASVGGHRASGTVTAK